MSISSSQASLKAVRQDLDLSAAGSISDRAVLNKVNKQSGPVSLSEYKGNVLGTQLFLPNDPILEMPGSWKKIRSESFATYYVLRNGQATISGSSVLVSATDTQSNTGDYGTEVRICGRISELANYRLTGSAYGRFGVPVPGNMLHSQMHINLLANASGYLSGSQRNAIDIKYYRGDGSGEQKINRLVTLDSDKPYITLVFRYIYSGMGSDYSTNTHQFLNFKLVKE